MSTNLYVVGVFWVQASIGVCFRNYSMLAYCRRHSYSRCLAIAIAAINTFENKNFDLVFTTGVLFPWMAFLTTDLLTAVPRIIERIGSPSCRASVRRLTYNAPIPVNV